MDNRKPLVLTTTISALTICALVTSCGSRQVPDLGVLLQDAQQIMEFVENPFTKRPSFIRTLLSLETLGVAPTDTTEGVVIAFVNRYAGLFGLEDAQRDLEYVHSVTGPLGMRHITAKQVFQGVDVYGASVTLHLSTDGGQVAVVNSSVVPNVDVRSTQPSLDADSALAVARRFMPGGSSVSSSLAVYPGIRREASAKLAWMVELRDESLPARKVYVVDAANGEVLDSLDRFYTSRDRRTHHANNGTNLPGTLARSEGEVPTGDQDVDDAHDFAGDTYDYFFNTHGRDSFDDAGATLISSAHFGVNYANAGWDGVQMIYGDGYAVKDVAAHELTHAVTERTADLEYRWQSGALNESFSDIFGVMVDRDDWLLGEDLPGGTPIRSISNPPDFGQPDHTDDWFNTCSDNEGVHRNSGITNKAFFNIASDIGKDAAERIFYRALTVFLNHQTQATLEDARSAALQAASDLFGNGSAEVQAVNNGFAAVGLNGSWQPSGRCRVPDMSVAGLLALALVVILLAVFGRRPLVAGR